MRKKLLGNYVLLEEKSVIMRIGGTNIVEREEVYRRIEDAINSLGNAIEYGMVPGAGVAYKYLVQEINNDEEIPDFVIKAMSTIYNRLNEQEVNNDVYDSAMVVKEVIVNSFSIVSQVITTNVIIRENIR